MPTPTPSTVAQENALASVIPLNGTDLVPLHWRMPAVKTADAPAVLAARRATAFDTIAFSTPSPAAWAENLLAVRQLDIGIGAHADLYQLYAETKSPAWKDRLAGPVWIWVMNIHRESADRVSIYQCHDKGWLSTAGEPRTARDMTLGGVTHLVASKLSHYTDGARWKVTDYDITGHPDKDRYQKQCKAWADTHTTTEGWTLPPEPTASP